ncbi:MAG: pilus (MSHA type) biogenesis protein MshL [Pseudomonadales bacterium]|nr:pilus (MSHA type) biogenesis protein MshL [Pseudomonadales bacterium]
MKVVIGLKPIVTKLKDLIALSCLPTSALFKARSLGLAVLGLAVLLLSACQAQRPSVPSQAHLKVESRVEGDIPPTIARTTVLPRPSKAKKIETYTVVVDSVPVKELLFSMARDAKLNLDIDDSIEGRVTLNAVNQSLPQILDRISELTSIRYSIDTGQLRIRSDDPYLKIYRIDYLNMGRSSESAVKVSTQISATGQGAGESGSEEGDNNSSTVVENKSVHSFWETITKNVNSLMTKDSNVSGHVDEGDDDAGGDEVSYDKDSIIVNRESGIMAIRATQREHKDIQAFLDVVLNAVQRQVLVEATIAEVTLSDIYKAGIDWQALQAGENSSLTGASDTSGVNLVQSLAGGELSSGAAFLLKLTDTALGDNRVDITLKALEQFGDVKVMSSPKIMVLNNQTALLKVVDNLVYFTLDADSSTSEGVTNTTFSTEVHTVPIGFVMSVTPFVDEYSAVTLNVRPTISRVIGSVNDPNPTLAQQNIVSTVPVIQVREMESILKVNSGDTAIIGGLMQDDVRKVNTVVPLLSTIPIIGRAFRFKSEEYIKTELVIFIRPVVVNQASLKRDLKPFAESLTAH